jgi:hypothetical protein
MQADGEVFAPFIFKGIWTNNVQDNNSLAGPEPNRQLFDRGLTKAVVPLDTTKPKIDCLPDGNFQGFALGARTTDMRSVGEWPLTPDFSMTGLSAPGPDQADSLVCQKWRLSGGVSDLGTSEMRSDAERQLIDFPGRNRTVRLRPKQGVRYDDS